MILLVPFFPGKRYFCAQDCMLMVLKYFFPEKEFDTDNLAKISLKHPEFGTSAAGLAKGLADCGLKVDFYLRSLRGEEPSKEDKKAYFDKYGDYYSDKKQKEMLDAAIHAGVKAIEKDFTIQDVQEALKQNKLIIPEINWNALWNKPVYAGHFVVLTGFDKENIYFHNPGPNHPEANVKVKLEVMERARDYRGTNKETVVVGK